MRGRMVGGAPCVPGDSVRRVTFEDQTIPIPRASTPNWLQCVTNGPPAGWNALGITAAAAALALAVTADGATLIALGWITR
jgi:hypothetical protein